MNRQQVLFFIDHDPVEVNQAAGGSNGKIARDFGGYLLKAQHAVVFPIDPDASPRTRYGIHVVTGSELEVREFSLHRVLVDNGPAPSDYVRVHGLKSSARFVFEDAGQSRNILSATGSRAADVLAVITSFLHLLH